MIRAIVVLLLIAAGAIATVCWVAQQNDATGITLEIGKTALNILTVAVIAQVATLVVAGAAERRKAQAADDELRRSTLRELTEAFSAVKSIRRRMRARLTYCEDERAVANATLGKKVYMSMMEELNGVQLRLEAAAKEVETSHRVFTKAKLVFDGISKMEEYLNRLVDEWEDQAGHRDGPPLAVALGDMPRLSDFLGPNRTSLFRPSVTHSYYATTQMVRESMGGHTAMTWKRAANRTSTAIETPRPVQKTSSAD